jgi:hypothetical protein
MHAPSRDWFVKTIINSNSSPTSPISLFSAMLWRPPDLGVQVFCLAMRMMATPQACVQRMASVLLEVRSKVPEHWTFAISSQQSTRKGSVGANLLRQMIASIVSLEN